MSESNHTNLPVAQKEINQWNFFIHLSQLSGIFIPLGNIIIPLVLWQIKKDQWPEVAEHGREVMNWQLSLLIYVIVGYILVFFLVGFVVLLALCIAFLVFAIVGAIKAQDGTLWKYPLTIRFLK